MKRIAVICCVAAVVLALCSSESQALVKREPGGIPAFFVGCCFGIRVGTQWNEGADLHWREWSALVPYWNIVLAIWNGADCYSGIKAHDWAEKNGANWY